MPHPHSYARVPSPCSEWPQAGDPAQDQTEWLLRLFSSRQPRPRCPFLSAERGGWGKGRGWMGQPANAGGAPARLTPRHTALWAVFEHRWAQKDGLSTFPQEIWNGYILFLFYSKLSGKSDFSLCDKLTWCKWSILSFNLLSTVKNFPDVWVEVKLESLLPVRILYFNLKIILFA